MTSRKDVDHYEDKRETWHWYQYFFIIGTITCCGLLFTFHHWDHPHLYYGLIGLALLFVLAFDASLS